MGELLIIFALSLPHKGDTVNAALGHCPSEIMEWPTNRTNIIYLYIANLSLDLFKYTQYRLLTVILAIPII